MARNDCKSKSCARFESPSTSIFIIFQGQYKGPKIKILISGAPKTYQTRFHIQALIWYNTVHTTCTVFIPKGRTTATVEKQCYFKNENRNVNKWLYCTVQRVWCLHGVYGICIVLLQG